MAHSSIQKIKPRVRKTVVSGKCLGSKIPIKLSPPIKLEPPEIFVSTPMGFQYVSRPEFSGDESDNFVITISSDESV